MTDPAWLGRALRSYQSPRGGHIWAMTVYLLLFVPAGVFGVTAAWRAGEPAFILVIAAFEALTGMYAFAGAYLTDRQLVLVNPGWFHRVGILDVAHVELRDSIYPRLTYLWTHSGRRLLVFGIRPWALRRSDKAERTVRALRDAIRSRQAVR